MDDDNLGFLPPVHFRSKNPSPPTRKPEKHANTNFRSFRPKSNHSFNDRRNKTKSYRKSSVGHNEDGNREPATLKRNHQDIDDGDEERNESVGSFQRSLSNFMFCNRSVVASPTPKKFIPHTLQHYEREKSITGEEESRYRPGRLGGFQRSLICSQIGVQSIKPSVGDSSSSPKSDKFKYGRFQRTLKDFQFGSGACTQKTDSNNAPARSMNIVTLRRRKNESPSTTDASDSSTPISSRDLRTNSSFKRIRREIDKGVVVNKIPGPIEYLPPMDLDQVRAHEQTLDNVMKNYYDQDSTHSKSPEPIEHSHISEEEWISVLDTVFLPEEMANESIKYTISAIHQMVDYRKRIPVTIGRIAKFDSNKRIVTIEDFTGEIKAIFHEKVLSVYEQQLRIGTMIVLINLAFLRVEGNNYLNVTLANIHWVSGSGQPNDKTHQLTVNDVSETRVQSTSNKVETLRFPLQTTKEMVQEGSSTDESIKQVDIAVDQTERGKSRVEHSTNTDGKNYDEEILLPDVENFSSLWSNTGDPEDLSWMLEDLEEITNSLSAKHNSLSENMIRHRQQGSNWLYRLTSSVVSLHCMLNNPVVADQMLVHQDDNSTKNYDTADSQNSDNAITTGTAITMIVLVLLFLIVSFVSFIRRRNSQNTPLSKDWKILDDFELEQSRHVPSPRFNDSFSVNSPSPNNIISYPDSVHTGNTKNSSRSTSFLNDPCPSDSRSESYSLRELSSTNSITLSKLPDVPPSLGDMPKFRTDSDTWEKYLEMMNRPEKLNETVILMGRTGHSPHSSGGRSL
ncbi:12255_t:CDS:2 [Acaulospora morrowiae]|uniref:12255_t:CDS:1 n=1 Tax=Acaulospora morrowiae TaxID=94023 RepID=A0A9N8ZJJ4_9GLOM|nr:12255_t:CDS:2 [Acaulospora morrowiae]